MKKLVLENLMDLSSLIVNCLSNLSAIDDYNCLGKSNNIRN